MKQMTPREALYYICLELGPSVPQTQRDDNLSSKEKRLRDSIRALQNFIDYHDTGFNIPDSAEEYKHKEPEDYGLPPLSREDFIE
jgi:hypothetical protein